MGINKTKFGSTVYPDADGLNNLVQNDIYLSNIMPWVSINYPGPGNVVSTAQGERTRIVGGMYKISKKFKGTSDIIEIKMPATPTPGPPIITLTVQSRFPAVAYIVGWGPSYQTAKVRITLLDRTRQTTATLYWHAIMGIKS